MGKHVHEHANLHIDTDGAVYDADTPEERMRAILEAIANDNIEFTIETNGDNE